MTAAYDARDRMIAWGRMRAGYRSDGKRAWKIILDESGAEVSRKYFLYDGDNLLCELDGQLRVTSTSTWGANGLVSRATNSYDGNGTPINGATTFYAYDERGSVAERVTDNGSGTPVVNHVAFDAWGYGTAGDSVGFGGQWGYYTDTETGLILCTHRYYDPSKQRWVTRDPIEYDGGINLYGYVRNNPVKLADPDGLAEVWTMVDGDNRGRIPGGGGGGGARRRPLTDAEKLDNLLAERMKGVYPFMDVPIGVPMPGMGRFPIVKPGPMQVRKRGGAITRPSLSSGLICDNEEGVTIIYHRGDHGPAHLHVTGKGPDTKIGQGGKPIESQPELSVAQRKVVERNKGKIRNFLRKAMRLHNFDRE